MNILLLELLKKARLNCNLKQKEVAEKLGIKDNTLSNWEKGRTEPDIDTFVKLCDIYCVNAADLLEQAYRLKSKEYTVQQKNVIEAYINKPNMQAAVDTLLGIHTDKAIENKKTPSSRHDIEAAAEVGDLAELDADEVLKNNSKTSSVD